MLPLSMDVITPFLICLFSFSAILLTKLHDIYRSNSYEVGAYVTSNLLIFFLINDAKNLTLLNIAILVKVIPTVLLALFGFLVLHDTKLTVTKGMGIVAVVAGLLLLEL
jgi:multidrug transporter EmrE-like cation transporter